MIACREKHGLRGYGIYINILALMYEQEDNTLPLDYHLLALEMREDEDVVKSVILDFKLFRVVKDKNEFFSMEVGKEIERRNDIRGKRRDSINQRWKKDKKEHQPPTPPVVDEVTPTATKSIALLLDEKDKNRFQKATSAAEPAPMAATPPPKLTAEQAKEITKKTLQTKIEPETHLIDKEKEEYNELLHYFFFSRFLRDAHSETARFWNFYNRVGWKDAKGRLITNKFSAARVWNTGEAPKFTKDIIPFIAALQIIYICRKRIILPFLNL